MLIILTADFTPAIKNSFIRDGTFHQVYGLSLIAFFASMLAYLFTLFINIRIFHFWKKRSQRKYL
jgi:uncharacterized PurR-regulated membrane protein YhhQ (DUF165 family)